MGFDLWEAKFLVVRVHLSDLLARRRAQYFDDFDQLIDAALARKDRLTEKEFSEHAARRPDICKQRVTNEPSAVWQRLPM